jgi:hypothetical protein
MTLYLFSALTVEYIGYDFLKIREEDSVTMLTIKSNW